MNNSIIIKTNKCSNSSKFNQPEAGENKGAIESLSINGSRYLLFPNRIDNINSFLISRVYKYIGIETFNSYILDCKNTKKVIIENLFMDKNSSQPNEKMIANLLYFDDYFLEQFMYKKFVLHLFGNYDSSFLNTIIQNNTNINFIDLINFESIKNIYGNVRVINDMFFNSSLNAEEFICSDTLYRLNTKCEEFEKNLKDAALNFFKEEFAVTKDMKLEKASLILSSKQNTDPSNFKLNFNFLLKDIVLKHLENYKNNTENKTFSDFLNYFIDFSRINSRIEYKNIEQQVQNIIKNLLLLDKNDVSYILLDYKPELIGIKSEELDRYKDSIYSKQLEMFFYFGKHKKLNTFFIISKPKEEEIWEKLNLESSIFEGVNITIETFDDCDWDKAEQIAKNINNSDNYKDAVNYYKPINEEHAISFYDFNNHPNNKNFLAKVHGTTQSSNGTTIKNTCDIKIFIQNKNDNFTKYNELKDKFALFQKLLIKEFNKKSASAWSEESYKNALYNNNIYHVTINQLIDNQEKEIKEYQIDLPKNTSSALESLYYGIGTLTATLIIFVLLLFIHKKNSR